MTQLKEQVQSLAAEGKRDTAIVTALKNEHPSLTRHRVRVILATEPSAELAKAEPPLLVSFTLPDLTPPIYHGGPSLEERADAWETVDRSLQNHYWYLGATAADLDGGKYGDGAVERFAELVGKSAGRVYQLIRTYKAFRDKDVSGQLSFTHYQYAAESDNPDYWIRRAHDEGLSTRKLEDLIKGKRLPEFRLHEPEPESVVPITESGYGPFPPDERVEPEPHERSAEVEVVKPSGNLTAWKNYARSHPCYSCGTTQEIEAAHLECLPSKKHSGMIPRRNGLGEWPCLPLCANCHRTGADSVHSLGEDSFFELHRGKAHAVGYVTRLLLEYFL